MCFKDKTSVFCPHPRPPVCKSMKGSAPHARSRGKRKQYSLVSSDCVFRVEQSGAQGPASQGAPSTFPHSGWRNSDADEVPLSSPLTALLRKLCRAPSSTLEHVTISLVGAGALPEPRRAHPPGEDYSSTYNSRTKDSAFSYCPRRRA